ncbi:MAG: PQQ-binding-like beta-propeller repeat protein [Planctomycetota bacterium]|nr:PQQ-binding-like beta-propeller repeat protein [Planctomycetota bacterium]
MASGSIFTHLMAGILALAGTCACQQGTGVLDWADYRGPSADGHAATASVPLRWSESKNVTFKVRIRGRGWSTPVIGHGRAWLTSARPDGHEMSVHAIDVKTGAVLVDRALLEVEKPAKVNRLNSYASPSPVLDDKHVYLHFGTYGTFCLDAETAEEVWKRTDLRCDHMEGPGSTPILYEDLLVFNVDGADVQYVIALDKATGETRWRTNRSVDLKKFPRDLRKAFSTPLVIEVDGEPRIISSGAEATVGYEPVTGREVWRVRHPGFSMSARPLFSEGVLFLNTGFMRTQIYAVQAAGKGDVTEDNVVWKYRRSVPRMSSGLLVDGRYYMVSDGGIVTCLDPVKGQLIWKKRIGNEHSASPVFAGGRIYFFDREGRATVIDPDSKGKILATNKLASGFMASPAVVGDAFLLRTKTHLYRIENPVGR